MTPGQAAKKWAKEHNTFAGILEVISTTKKGKGGWGETTRTNTFFVKNGSAVADRKKGDIGTPGICSICCEVFLEPVLNAAHTIEPLAGTEVSDEDRAQFLYSSWMREQYGDAPLTWGQTANLFPVCPSCLSLPNVYPGHGCHTWLNKELVVYRYHPTTENRKKIPREQIDIR